MKKFQFLLFFFIRKFHFLQWVEWLIQITAKWSIKVASIHQVYNGLKSEVYAY